MAESSNERKGKKIKGNGIHRASMADFGFLGINLIRILVLAADLERGKKTEEAVSHE
jgi:hypothetical protein